MNDFNINDYPNLKAAVEHHERLEKEMYERAWNNFDVRKDIERNSLNNEVIGRMNNRELFESIRDIRDIFD